MKEKEKKNQQHDWKNEKNYKKRHVRSRHVETVYR